jgi:hypothetical protein
MTTTTNLSPADAQVEDACRHHQQAGELAEAGDFAAAGSVLLLGAFHWKGKGSVTERLNGLLWVNTCQPDTPPTSPNIPSAGINYQDKP